MVFMFLAIVFGPSIVKKSNDSLESAVKDMKHQCQIVESLISHVSVSCQAARAAFKPFIHYSTATSSKTIRCPN